jgi:hypothetical protein
MSGLIGFFKDFLPNVTNIDHDRRWEDLTDTEKEVDGMPRFGGTKDPILAALSRPCIKPQVDYFPDVLTFEECRRLSRQSIQAFYQRRLVTPEEEEQKDNGRATGYDDDWNSDSENDNQHEEVDVDQDEETGGNELALGSQPAVPDTNHRAEPPTSKNRRKWRVPPLYQAIHSIQSLQYLDLRTKDITLDLCKVTKIWKLRKTRRGYKYMTSTNVPYQQQCCILPGRMPRFVFGNLDDDGPLSTAYKYVLSLELEQLVPSHQQQATADFTQRKRAIRVFLYDGYAKAVSQWMGKQSKSFRSNRNMSTATINNNESNTPGYILSLFKVPALSIFPQALDPRDWWDQEHVIPYCICLGASSNMIASTEEGNTTIHLRADSDEVELRLATTSSTSSSTMHDSRSSGSELVLSKRLLTKSPDQAQREEEDVPTPSVLRTRWRKYCETTMGRSASHKMTSPSSRPPPPVQQQQQQPPPPPPIVEHRETQPLSTENTATSQESFHGSDPEPQGPASPPSPRAPALPPKRTI